MRTCLLAKAGRRYHFVTAMNNAVEKRLIEALKNVDAHGDVAPSHVHDPMTMVLRENAVRGNLMLWDDVRDRYVLTGSGRRRIRAVSERIESVGGFPNRLISRTPSKSLLQAQSLSAQNRRTDRRGPHARPRNLRRNLQALAMYKLLQILWL